MAEVSYPHEDYPTEGAGAVTEAEYAAGVGWATPSGLIGATSDPAPLFLSSGVLYLRAGTAARLVGMAYLNKDDDLPIDIDDNGAGSTRLDQVVLRLDWSTMLVRAAVLKGTAGGTLPPVTQQRGTGVFEVSAGQAAIPAGGTVANAVLTRRGWYIGPDGQYLCTEDSRPPHTPGRRIWQTDDGREYVSNGAPPWRIQVDDSGQLPVTLVAGWDDSSKYLRRLDGQVNFQLSVQRDGGSLGAGLRKVATLPASCRPDARLETVFWATGGASPTGRYGGYVDIRTNGEIWVDLHQGLVSGAFVVCAPASFVST